MVKKGNEKIKSKKKEKEGGKAKREREKENKKERGKKIYIERREVMKGRISRNRVIIRGRR